MHDAKKTKSQLIDELKALRKRIAELEGSLKCKGRDTEPPGKQAAFHVIDAMADPLVILDFDGRFLFINEAHERMSGYKRAEVVGRHFSEFLQEAIKEEEIDEIRHVTEVGFSGEQTPPLEFTFLTTDGREVPLSAAASFLNDEKGDPTGVVVTFRDMTELKKAEKTLRESEERFRALFEGSLDAIFLVDPDSGETVDANPAASELLSRPMQDIIGMHYSNLAPLRLKERARRLFEELIEESSFARPIETLVVTSQGKEVPVELLAQIIQLHGVPVLLGTLRDLTERKRVEEALRHSQERYRLLAQNSPDIIMIINADRSFRYISPAIERILGYSPKEAMEQIGFDQLHPEDRVAAEAAFSSFLEIPGSVLIHLFRFRHKDGSWRFIEAVGNNVLDNPAMRGIVLNCRDITERRRIEEALEKSERKYRFLYENLREGSSTVDLEGRIVECNSTFQEMLGYDAQEICGLTFRQITPEKWHAMEARIIREQVMKRGYSDVYEKEYVRKDGTTLPVELRTHLVQDEDGNPLGRWSIVRDVTERKRMEEELLKTQKLESLGILCGGIAHDFNNILTAVLTNISMAQMYGTLEEDIEKMLEDAEKASLRGKGLTQQLLTFAKGGEPVKNPVSVPALLRDTIGFALSGSNVRCAYDLAEDLWPVEADDGQIGQVLHNVILNADQAMPGGGVVEVRAENITVTQQDPLPLEPGNHVKISIIDHGIGIPKEHLPKVFDPFFTTKQKGSGLGLSTSFSIIRRHNGTLQVESRLGRGTNVHIYLPALPEGHPVRGKKRDASYGGEGRVLLVDDDETLRRSIGMALGRLGYQVETAEDGAEGVEAYQRARASGRPMDVVVMDLTIPGGMGGKEAARELMKIDPDAKLIVSSGYSTDPVMSDFKSYGFRAVISKPYRIEDLGETLRSVLTGD